MKLSEIKKKNKQNYLLHNSVKLTEVGKDLGIHSLNNNKEEKEEKVSINLSFSIRGNNNYKGILSNILVLIKKIFIIFLLVATISNFYIAYIYYQKYNEIKETGIQNLKLIDPLQYALGAVTENNEEKGLESLARTDGRTNFLLMGVDARQDFFDSFRTDTLIIASYNHIENETLFISIPRDMQAEYNDNITKINAIFQFTYNENKLLNKSNEESLKISFEKLSYSVKEVTGLDIHYGIMINFGGLKDIVDALGGITVDVDTPLYDNLYPNNGDNGIITIYFPKGVTQMNGEKALQYVRSRKTTSDYDRARRQQKVISAIKDKFLTSSFFTDPYKVNNVLTALSKNIKFFNISSNEINVLINGKNLLENLKVYNLVLDPYIGSFTGSILKGGEPIKEAGFLIYPTQGDYNELKSFIKLYLKYPELLSEDAQVILVWTNSERYRDFIKIGQYIINKNLPFTMRHDFISTSSSGVSSMSPTPKHTTNELSIYTNGDKQFTLTFYEKLFNENNVKVTKKEKEELPKELEKIFSENDILMVVD